MIRPVLIGGSWRFSPRPAGVFQAIDPSDGSRLPDAYPVSDWTEAEEALAAGREAAASLRSADPESLAGFLDDFASSIERNAERLTAAAHLETALPIKPRLIDVELPRTTDQLRQAAAAVRDRSWRRATIDTRMNIRSIRAPLGGAVFVLGPNNFPFAFNSAAGGDFAAALAAGNPVIAKAHPGHPGTTRLLAELAFESVMRRGLPAAALQLIYDLRPEDGLKLAAHPLVGATSFTGSRPSGLRLKEAADRAGKPIYLEMSSVNPVFLLPGALAEKGAALAAELFASCTLGQGQFCTKPGLVAFIDGAPGPPFVEAARKAFDVPPPGFLLSEAVLRGAETAVAAMAVAKARLLAGGKRLEGPGFRLAPTLLLVNAAEFLADPSAFQKEAFGPVSLLVAARDEEELAAVAAALEGNLTASIYSSAEGSDDALYARVERHLRMKAGRLLNDKMPTGVAVVPAMVHGGPFPASGHPGFTSVGIPASLLRFTALQAYDNVRPDRLPPELRDRNPTGTMWRLIDGAWTQADV